MAVCDIKKAIKGLENQFVDLELATELANGRSTTRRLNGGKVRNMPGGLRFAVIEELPGTFGKIAVILRYTAVQSVVIGSSRPIIRASAIRPTLRDEWED